MKKALDLVHQVENPTGNPLSEAQRIDLLTQALTLAKEAPNHRLKGHRVQAIQNIKAALAAIQGGDADHKAIDYIHAADTELTAAVAISSNSKISSSDVADQLRSPNRQSTSDANAALPAGVTTEMEQAFLGKFKAALEEKTPDAYFSLIANDPNIDPKTMEEIKGWEVFGAALAASNPNRTYAFVPVTPGQQSQPTEFSGKMYDAYLPAVVALKITFAIPDHPAPKDLAVKETTIPLGIKNNQLMMIGVKEIIGAVPPPFDKSKNFGIKPNKRKIDSDEEFDNADNFVSLGEFLSGLKQPSVKVIASGESELVYWAVCRVPPNLCIYAEGSHRGKGGYSSRAQITDSSKGVLKADTTFVRLLDPGINGTVFTVPNDYSGPLSLEVQYWDDSGKKTSSVSQTITWSK